MSTDNIKKAIKMLAKRMHSNQIQRDLLMLEINKLLEDKTPDTKFTYFYKHGDGFKEGPAPEGYDDGSGTLAEIETSGAMVTSDGVTYPIPVGGVVTINDDGTFDISAGTGNLKEAEDGPAIPEGWNVVTEGKMGFDDMFYNPDCKRFESTNEQNEHISDYICVIRKSQPEPVVPSGWEIVSGHMGFKHAWYRWKDGQWWSCGNAMMCGKELFIRQTINIDLSKQPIELKWFAMDEDGEWHGFSSKPRLAPDEHDRDAIGEVWSGDFDYHYIFKSQYPTWTGDFKDSLLCRPETQI